MMTNVSRQALALAVALLSPVPLYFAAKAGAGVLTAILLALFALSMLVSLFTR